VSVDVLGLLDIEKDEDEERIFKSRPFSMVLASYTREINLLPKMVPET
jgi:hypothetical protein